jgi:hypothetical protein
MTDIIGGEAVAAAVRADLRGALETLEDAGVSTGAGDGSDESGSRERDPRLDETAGLRETRQAAGSPPSAFLEPL